MSTSAVQIIREEHAALAAMLRSLVALVDRRPEGEQRFFEVARAMLVYIDEFPERRHHPNESKYLFPPLARSDVQLRDVIQRLETDHLNGVRRVRELQHLLAAWEMLGDSRRDAFVCALRDYVGFYLNHMRVEETELLPAAQRLLSVSERMALDSAFVRERDPLAGGSHTSEYDRLFSHIVRIAPAPIGVGAA